MKNKFFSRALALVLSIAVLAVGLPFAGLTASAVDTDTEYVIWEADPRRAYPDAAIDDEMDQAQLGYDEEVGYYYYFNPHWASLRYAKSGCNNNVTKIVADAAAMTAIEGFVTWSADIKAPGYTKAFDIVNVGYNGGSNKGSLSGNIQPSETWSHVSGVADLASESVYQGYFGIVVSNGGQFGGSSYKYISVANYKWTVKESDRESINAALAASGSALTFDDLIAFDEEATYSSNKVDPNAPTEYVIWEVDPSRVAANDGDVTSVTSTNNTAGKMTAVRASENGELFHRITFTAQGAGNRAIINAGLGKGVDNFLDNHTVLSAIAPYIKISYSQRASESGATVYLYLTQNYNNWHSLCANKNTNANEWVDYSLKGITWDTTKGTPYSGYFGVEYYKSGAELPQTVDIKSFRLSLEASDKDAINQALTDAGVTTITFDTLTAWDANSNYTPNKTRIKVSDVSGGSIAVSSTVVAAGDTVTVTATKDAGYVLDGVTAITASGAAVELTATGNEGEYTFIAPSEDVTLSAAFTYVGNEYAIASSQIGEGTVTLSETVAQQGDEITITAVGAHGYKTKSISATDSNGVAVALTKSGFNYTFSMPDASVNVSVEFEAIAEAERKYVIWEADPALVAGDLELASYTKDELSSGTIKNYTNYPAYKMPGENEGDPSYYNFTLYGNGDSANTLLKTPLTKSDAGLEWMDQATVLQALNQYMSFSYESRSYGSVPTNIYVNLSNGYNKIGGLTGFKSDVDGDWELYTTNGLAFTEWWNGAVNFSHWVSGGVGEDGVTVDIRKMKIEVSNYDAELINYALSGTAFTFESITAFDEQSSYTNNKYSKVTTNFVGSTADVTYTGLNSDDKAVSGSKISFTVADKRGFTLVGVVARTANGDELALTNTDGTYSFTMPASEVTVVVTLTSDGSMVFDEYVIWEADPTRGYNSANVGDEIQNSGFTTVLGEENGEYFYSATSGNNSWGWSYLSTGLNSNSYSIPWIGNSDVLKAIDEYLKVSCDVRSSVANTKIWIKANTGDGSYYDDVKVYLLSGTVGTEWQTLTCTVDFSDMGVAWYGGNIMLQAYGATPTVDIRNFYITVSEDDRAAINAALTGTGFTFDDIVAFDPSSNCSGNYLEYNRISLSHAKLDTNGITASNIVGLKDEKKAKAGATISVDVGSVRRQKLVGIKVTAGDGTDIPTNGLSFVMPEQAVRVVTFATDDISHRTTFAVDTGNNTQQINFISTFKHTLDHLVAGYDIKATLADGTTKYYHIYGNKVFEEINGITAYSVSGNNDGYAFVAGISDVPTNIGAIEFEVTPFVYDTYKNGIIKGETEKVYYFGGAEETGMIKSDASRTASNYTVSFAKDHPGVVGMDAEYTLVVNGNPSISIVNANDFSVAPTLSGNTLTVPYAVRNSETKLKLNVGGEIFWIDFPKFTDNATFSDDFDTLDESKWSAYQSDAIQNVEIENGALVMKTDADNAASSLSTSGKFSQSYGSFSARIKVPAAGNGCAAFWLYSIPNKSGIISSDGSTIPVEPYVPNLENVDWNSAGEIDVIERSAKWADSEYATSLHWNGHTDGDSTSKASAQEKWGINIADGNYHTFTTVWTETSITWYVDGNLLFQYTPGGTMNPEDCAELRDDGMGVGPDSGEMMLILQNAVNREGTSSSWTGAYDASDFANGQGYMYVDSVSVYGLQ